MSYRSNRFQNLNMDYSFERYFGMLEMPNRNGIMVLSVLKSYTEPVTATQLSKDMSELVSLKPDKVKQIINETLSAGVEHGFIQKKKSKYYTDEEPVHQLTNRIRSNIQSVSNLEEADVRPKRKNRNKPDGSLKRKRSETPEIEDFDAQESFATVVGRLTFSDSE